MTNVRITSVPIIGTADGIARTICIEDNDRAYVSIVATSGNPTISIGDVTHTDVPITIAEGNMFELGVNCISKIQYAGAATTAVLLQDITSDFVLSYDNVVLTYGGNIMVYNINGGTERLSTPVFS